MFRGEKEEVLDLTLDPGDVPAPGGDRPAAGPAVPAQFSDSEALIAARFGIADQGRPADRWLADTVRLAWRARIQVHLGVDLRMRLWQQAEDEAVRVFAANLRDLLLAAPAGRGRRWALTRGCAPASRSRS